MLKDLGLVGVWLSAEGLEPAQFDEERASAFLAARRRAGHRQVPGQRAMVPLVTYLREAGVVPAQNLALSPLGELRIGVALAYRHAIAPPAPGRPVRVVDTTVVDHQRLDSGAVDTRTGPSLAGT